MSFDDQQKADTKRINELVKVIDVFLRGERADIALEAACIAISNLAVDLEVKTGEPVTRLVAEGFMVRSSGLFTRLSAMMGAAAKA